MRLMGACGPLIAGGHDPDAGAVRRRQPALRDGRRARCCTSGMLLPLAYLLGVILDLGPARRVVRGRGVRARADRDHGVEVQGRYLEGDHDMTLAAAHGAALRVGHRGGVRARRGAPGAGRRRDLARGRRARLRAARARARGGQARDRRGHEPLHRGGRAAIAAPGDLRGLRAPARRAPRRSTRWWSAPGAKHALFNLAQALYDHGDEVVIPVPAWGSYADQAQLCGARPVLVPCAERGRLLAAARRRSARGAHAAHEGGRAVHAEQPDRRRVRRARAARARRRAARAAARVRDRRRDLLRARPTTASCQRRCSRSRPICRSGS